MRIQQWCLLKRPSLKRRSASHGYEAARYAEQLSTRCHEAMECAVRCDAMRLLMRRRRRAACGGGRGHTVNLEPGSWRRSRDRAYSRFGAELLLLCSP